MKTKTVRKYIYDGLGFPVELHDVEMVMIDGEFHPKIDVRKVADSTINSLVLQQTRLTGNQIKFIRTYFSMSLREFTRIANESHMAIKKWEDYKDKPTNMDKNVEIMLRLQIYDHITSRKQKNKKAMFYDHFSALINIFSHSVSTQHLKTA